MPNHALNNLYKLNHGTIIRDNAFRTTTPKGDGDGGLEICHVIADFIVLKQQIYCLLLLMVVVVGEGHLKDWSLFVDVVNRGPLIVPWLNKSSC